MVHLVYCNDKTNEINKINMGIKTMIIRGATGRKIPHSRVFINDTLFFMEKGSKKITASAMVTEVKNYVKLSDSEIKNIINENNDKLCLTQEEKNRWHKKCLCLVSFSDVKQITPLNFFHQANMDDWLILDKIEDVLEGSSKPYDYTKSRLKI